MRKILRGEGILPLLFMIDSDKRDARAGRPRHERQGQDGLATYNPEGICACPEVDHA